MKLDLIRHTVTPESIIGSLAIDGVFCCFTLENPLELNPALGAEHLAIPYGEYKIGVRFSRRFMRQVPELHDVPNRTNIEIHPGNAVKDTHGCILPGKTRAKNFVGNSVEAFEELYGRIRAAVDRNEEITIEIAPTQGDTGEAHGSKAG